MKSRHCSWRWAGNGWWVGDGWVALVGGQGWGWGAVVTGKLGGKLQHREEVREGEAHEERREAAGPPGRTTSSRQ